MSYRNLSASADAQPRIKRFLSTIGFALSTTPGVVVAGTTPVVLWGTGVPSETAPNGSLAIRLDGSNPSEVLYFRQGGAWVAGALDTSLLPKKIDIAIGAESSDVISVTLQLVDGSGAAVASQWSGRISLLDGNAEPYPDATAFKASIGGSGSALSADNRPVLVFQSDLNGEAIIDLTDVGGASGANLAFMVEPFGVLGAGIVADTATFDGV